MRSRMRNRMNPVLVSGIKRRMRGLRTPILMAVFYLLLLGVFALTYSAMANTGSYSYYGYVARPGVAGADLLLPLYALLVVALLMLILLLAPALNASNISSEREKQTLDLLLSSRLSAIRIVMGKILANLAFIAFLLMLALPFFAVLYLFGSIQPLDILLIYGYMLITAYACASIATFFSALMKKTSAATILTYVALIVFCIVTFAAGFYIMSVRSMQSSYSYYGDYIPLIMRINPLYALVELVANASGNSTASTAVRLLGGDASSLSLLYSAVFMLLFSPLFNIAAAVLIKPVQKFQMKGGKAGGRAPLQAYPLAQLNREGQKYPVYPISPAVQAGWQPPATPPAPAGPGAPDLSGAAPQEGQVRDEKAEQQAD